MSDPPPEKDINKALSNALEELASKHDNNEKLNAFSVIASMMKHMKPHIKSVKMSSTRRVKLPCHQTEKSSLEQ